MNPLFSAEKHPQSIEQLKKNWGWYAALGIVLIILGSLAVIYAFTSTILSIIYFGSLLLVRGCFEIIKAFKLRLWSNFFLHLLVGFLYSAGGSFILWNPLINAEALTLVLAIFFVISGISKLAFAGTYTTPNRTWLILNGACTLVLGILIWKQWPASGLWAIGMLVGVDTLFTGWTWLMLSLAAKNMPPIKK